MTLPSEESDVEVEDVNILYNYYMHACMDTHPHHLPNPSHTHTHLKKDIEPEMETVEKDSRDSRGISGWDRVDKLARALVNLSRLCVSTPEAKEIKRVS